MKALVSNGSRLCALRPQRIATNGLGLPSASVRAFNARIAASVTSSQPLPDVNLAVRRDSQTSVEQHHPTFRPRCQIAVGGHGHPKVVNQFLINIDQAFRQRVNIWRHAEAQTHRVTRGRVGVLADNQHLDGIERDGERAQNIVACRQPRAPAAFSARRKSPIWWMVGSTSAKAWAHPGSTSSLNGLIMTHHCSQTCISGAWGVVWWTDELFADYTHG